MAQVNLTIRELRNLIEWTRTAIRQEEAAGGAYSESRADLLGELEDKLEKALDSELEALIEIVRG